MRRARRLTSGNGIGIAGSTHGITGDLLCGKLVDKAHCPSRSVLQGPFFSKAVFCSEGSVPQ